MAILSIITTKNGQATKASLEAASYAAAWAESNGTEAAAIVSGQLNGDGGLGATGIQKVLHCAESFSDEGQLARIAASAAESIGALGVVMSHDHLGIAVAPRVAVRLNAGLVSGVTQLPVGTIVRRNVFSGKAMADVESLTERRVYTVTPNAFGVNNSGSGEAIVESFSADAGPSRLEVLSTSEASGDGMVPLPEAELVVSAGRGLKGPENWGIVEDLASALGATTACSRPVSDIGWRPHHEHVGQTGITIRPNLYIAAGISGAIQHLAGVNQSKVIVVINTDPDAPFFKAADYGIVGDAFEVLPKLTAAVKALGS
ncbi:MAG: electron transfer flavoprotein subunit alpha/FixB family protein [Flavobacteriales bacterium]